MPKAPDGQYELVLENRQVLTIFFAVVVLCGVFFGLGYTVGKNTMGYIPPADGSVMAAAGKKSAIQPVNATETRKEEPAAAPAAAPPASDLTYGRSLEQKASSAQLETQPAAGPPAETKPAAGKPGGTPAAAPAAAEGAISLQVAALSKKEDAEALLGLLNKKGFRASIVTGEDRLYRVQIGPFSKPKDAEETKAQLAQEGFKPITKK